MRKASLLLIALLAFGSLLLTAGDEHSCAGHGEEHASCPIRGKKIASSDEVTIAGKLLCRHCNLRETNSCEKVFVPEGSEERYAVCAGSDLQAAEAAGDYGRSTITVSGTLVSAEDGTKMLKIESAKKKS